MRASVPGGGAVARRRRPDGNLHAVVISMDTVRDFLNTRLFVIGGSVFTPAVLGVTLVLVVALFVLTKWLSRWGAARMLRRRNADPGAVYALFQILRYLVLVTGLIVIVQSVGVNLSAFVVVIGTLGIGIGFALQPVLTNLLSGFVLLVERPLKIGDRIELGELAGRVTSIGARATRVLTNDNIAVIVPNSQLVQSQIINWSHSDRRVRIDVPVGVSYGSDPEQVRRVLLEVAGQHPGVLQDDETEVLLEKFADSALEFTLRVWTEDYLERPRLLRSELNFAICAALRVNKIEIPFPQRDVHIKTHVERGAAGA